MNINLEDSILEFLGSRYLTNDLKDYLKLQEKELKGSFFRGLPYPKHLLKIGSIIEEWHGSTHFTIDENIAQNFAIINRNGYINDDYYDELSKELNSDEVEFVQLIMICNFLVGIEIYKLLEKLNIDNFKHEKEITTFDKNFVIKSIEKRTAYGEELYYAKVDII